MTVATDSADAPRLLSSTQVAKLFAVDPGSVRAWARQGLVPCFRTPGGKYRFYEEDVRRYIEDQAA